MKKSKNVIDAMAKNLGEFTGEARCILPPIVPVYVKPERESHLEPDGNEKPFTKILFILLVAAIGVIVYLLRFK